MPTANVLLQLYKGGWRTEVAPVIVDNLMIEAALGSGSVESAAEASRIAQAELARYAAPIVSEVVAVEPVDFADTPWLSHIPGDLVACDGDDRVVESLTFQRDSVGHITYAAELDSHHDTPEERMELSAKKMSNGTLGGTSRPAQPLNLDDQPRLMVPASNACCTWAFNGVGGIGGTDIDPNDSAPALLAPSDLGALYPSGTFLGPSSSPELPAGVWHLSGWATVTLDAPPSAGGYIRVSAYNLPVEPGLTDPAAFGGQIRGTGYANGATLYTFPVTAAFWLADPWPPGVLFFNLTDAVVLDASLNLFGMGTSCYCSMGSAGGEGG